MTDNTQAELDEQIKEFVLDIWHLALDEGYGTSERRSKLVVERENEFLQATLDWHNKQVEELLDRLEKEINTGRTFTNDYVISEAIETERNKLKKASE